MGIMGMAGILIAGGRSTRMGADKALLEFGGIPAISRIAAALGEVAAPVVLACGAEEREEYRFLGLRQAVDRFPGSGPLAGLHAGMSAVEAEWYLAAACDLPFASAAFMRYIVDAMKRSGWPVGDSGEAAGGRLAAMDDARARDAKDSSVCGSSVGGASDRLDCASPVGGASDRSDCAPPVGGASDRSANASSAGDASNRSACTPPVGGASDRSVCAPPVGGASDRSASASPTGGEEGRSASTSLADNTGDRSASPPSVYGAAGDFPQAASRPLAAVPVSVSGQVQPLLGLYHKDTLPGLENTLSHGNFRVMRWLESLNVLYVPEAGYAGASDGEPSPLFNMNTPADYRTAADWRV